MNNVLIPILIMGLIYTTLEAKANITEVPIIGSRFFPMEIATSLLAFGGVLLALCFLGFVGTLRESKILIESYTLIVTLSTIALVV